MTRVLCVLRGGGEYRPEHAVRLADQVWNHSPRGTRFTCLTDIVDDVAAFGIDAEPLRHDWPGWWAKMEALALPGPALYLDLDVNVIGDLAPLLDACAEHDLIMARGFWGLDDPSHVNSSVMGWRGDLRALYREFASAPVAFMSIYKTREKWGDQAFVRDHWRGDMMLWQDLLPGMVASFKRGALMGEDLSDCRVLCSHGEPKPWAPGGADAWLAARGMLSSAHA